MIDHLVRTDFKAVDKRDGIGTLYGYLRGEVDKVPIVCDRGRPYGVVNEKRILRAHLVPEQHVDRFTVGPGVLLPDAEVDEALQLVAHEWIPHAPVWDGKRLLGYVRAVDLLREVDVEMSAASLAVEVPALAPGTSVGEAMHRFYEVASHVLPVVRDGRIVGVVSRQGLLPLATDPRAGGRKGAGGEFDDPRKPPIDGYVDGRFETVPATASFATVRSVLEEFGAAWVVDGGGRLVGVVTPESAAKAVLAARAARESPLRGLPLPGRRSEGLPR